MTKTLVVPLSAQTDAEFRLMLEDLKQLPAGWVAVDVASDTETSGAKIGIILVKRATSTKQLVFPLSAKSATEFDLFIEEWEALKPRWRLAGVDRALDSGVPVAQFTVERTTEDTAKASAPIKRTPTTKRASVKTVRKPSSNRI